MGEPENIWFASILGSQGNRSHGFSGLKGFRTARTGYLPVRPWGLQGESFLFHLEYRPSVAGQHILVGLL